MFSTRPAPVPWAKVKSKTPRELWIFWWCLDSDIRNVACLMGSECQNRTTSRQGNLPVIDKSTPVFGDRCPIPADTLFNWFDEAEGLSLRFPGFTLSACLVGNPGPGVRVSGPEDDVPRIGVPVFHELDHLRACEKCVGGFRRYKQPIAPSQCLGAHRHFAGNHEVATVHVVTVQR